jgi:hypothetical protein
MNKLTQITLFVFLFLVQSAWQSPVYAGEGPQFTLKVISSDASADISNGYYIFNAVPDTILTGEILVVNNGSEAGTTRLYAVDATTGQTGGTVFMMYEDDVLAAGSWLQLEQTELTLEAGERQVVPFTVAVPAEVRSGHHVGGIVAEAADSAADQQITNHQDEATFNVTIKTRTAVAVQVNVAGPLVEEIQIEGVYPGGAGGHQTLFLGIKNSGNAMMKPAGNMIVSDEAGQPVQDLHFQIDTFLPETDILFPIFVENEALPAGNYLADVNLTYGEFAISKQLNFRISVQQNTQIFSAQEALAAPAQAVASNENVSAWRPYVIGGLAFVNIGLIVVLAVLIVQYVRQRRRIKQRALPKAAPLYKMDQSRKAS